MRKHAILVINAGSSSIKFALFSDNKRLSVLAKGQIDAINDNPSFSSVIKDTKQEKIQLNFKGYKNSIEYIMKWIYSIYPDIQISSIGHRVVHGGTKFTAPTAITSGAIKELEDLIHLAPLHQPHSIEVIKIISSMYPDVKQVACFDTSFHLTQHKYSKNFAIPKNLTEQGIIRYGFHGISYEYISSVMHKYIGTKSKGKVIIAHLGNGSSICALKNKKSISTTMGFTALDGLMMGTRCGSIDPGVIFYLMQNNKMSLEEVIKLLYNKSGLLGVSGISNDMYVLENSGSESAKEAVDMYCYKAAKEISGLIPYIGGIDAIIFTGGIGTNSFIVRSKICELLKYLGIEIDNRTNINLKDGIISKESSKVKICIIPTNEEIMIAKGSIYNR